MAVMMSPAPALFPPPAVLAPRAGRALQFVSWKGFAAVGPELAEPVWVR
jgi:hypothetical protein